MSWNQPICVKCWNEQGRGRQVLEDPSMDHPTEVCCFCGSPAGRIYIRVDPATVPYPNPEAREVPAEQELREWVLSRPASVQEVIRRLPPGCTVRATVTLGIPAPDCIGQVVSYIEPGKEGRAGVRVRGRWNGIGPFMDAACYVDELELVEEGIVTCEQIDTILG